MGEEPGRGSGWVRLSVGSTFRRVGSKKSNPWTTLEPICHVSDELEGRDIINIIYKQNFINRMLLDQCRSGLSTFEILRFSWFAARVGTMFSSLLYSCCCNFRIRTIRYFLQTLWPASFRFEWGERRCGWWSWEWWWWWIDGWRCVTLELSFEIPAHLDGPPASSSVLISICGRKKIEKLEYYALRFSMSSSSNFQMRKRWGGGEGGK